jgi:hypothetical protein
VVNRKENARKWRSEEAAAESCTGVGLLRVTVGEIGRGWSDVRIEVRTLGGAEWRLNASGDSLLMVERMLDGDLGQSNKER